MTSKADEEADVTTRTQQGTDRFVQVRSLRLHYLEWGPENGSPVLLIHGLTGNAHNFDSLGPILAAKHRVLSLHVRGRGDSDWARDWDYTTEAYVTDLEGIRHALGLERISLVGTSMGGRISMAYASTFHDRVERAVINDIGPEIDPRGGERIRQYVGSAPERFENLDQLLSWYRKNYPQLDGMKEEEFKRYVGASVKPASDGGFTWKMDPAVRQAPRRSAAEDAWAWVKRITAPTLLIRGAESDILSPKVAWRMVAEMKECRLVEVSGVGHAPTLMEPKALDAVKAFFSVA